MSISPSLLIRKVVSMISASGRPSATGSRNSTPSCPRARATARIGSLAGRNCAIRHAALAHGWPQTTVHHRRLAAAGRSDDGEKVRVCQLVDHGVDLILPAEEQILLILPEGPQARKRVRLRVGHCAAHGIALALVTLLRALAAASSEKPPKASIRQGSCMSIKSCLSCVFGSAR